MPIKIPNDLPASKILKEENIFVSIKVNYRIDITRVNKFFCSCIIRRKTNSSTIKTNFVTHDKLCISRTIYTAPSRF